MTRTVIIFLLITGLLAKKYLIDVADKGEDEGVDSAEDEGGDEEGAEGETKEDGEGSEGGSDFSVNKGLRMVMDAGRPRLRRLGRTKKKSGDTLTLTCNVGSF